MGELRHSGVHRVEKLLASAIEKRENAELTSSDSVPLCKPFKTIDEQVDILKSRGLRIDMNARNALMREGYYPIVNGYKDLFLDAEAMTKAPSDAYRSRATFACLHRLFEFDRELRSLFMRYFAMAEATLKSVCAYKFTEAHSSEKNPYMKLENYREKYRKSGRAPDLIKEFGRAIGLDSSHGQWRKKEYLRHYVEKYDGEVPLWVLMKYLTLGQAFRFFCFLDEGMQNSIAKEFSEMFANSYGFERRIHPAMLRVAYDHIKDFRNICAHDERFYCARVSPSLDTSIAQVLEDLKMVIPLEQYDRLREEVRSLTARLVVDIGPFGIGVTEGMGFYFEELLPCATSSHCNRKRWVSARLK